MFGVQQIEEFVDPALLPKGSVRVAALDGENSDPADGLTLEGSLRAKTLWGELAWMPMQKKTRMANLTGEAQESTNFYGTRHICSRIAQRNNQ